jgi:hypothetical protein
VRVNPEQTALSPDEEAAFQSWVQANGLRDVDSPDAHYDMRGFWKQTQGAPHPPGSEMHFPDTFKQHGHPTFSQESRYSKGAFDGGMWVGPNGVEDGDTFVPQPPMAVSHAPVDATTALRNAVITRLRGGL